MSDTAKYKDYRLMIALAWTGFILVILAGIVIERFYAKLESARLEARMAFQKDLVYRRWAAMHGGVYVPVSQHTPPNPYLAHIPERDIQTPSGRKLTLMNPAYMSRQVYELGKEQFGFAGHITSLNPLRPANAPDKWEEGALGWFEKGRKEVSGLDRIDGVLYMRLIRPMITEKSCLKCHAYQGYKEGRIRGGISVSMPMKPFLAILLRHVLVLGIGSFLIWLFGLAGIIYAGRKFKMAARERLVVQEELFRASKLTAMGQLASGLAYEFNQPLTGIRGFAQFALEESGDKEKLAADMKNIIKQVDRMDRIIKGIMQFGYNSAFSPKPISINQPIENILDLINESLLNNNIRVIKRFPAELPKVFADLNQCEQVFFHLLGNARDAIAVSPRSQDGEIVIKTEFDRKSGFILVSVSDNGCGIPQKDQPNIFNPFFTTKPQGSGIGLGLAIVYRILESHKGRISFDSVEGKGSTFCVWFPVANPEVLPSTEVEQ